MDNPSRTEYDLIIVGGGMVGATLACALGNSGLRVAVIEAHAAPVAWHSDSRDLRVSAVTSGSVRIFDTLGVWPRMVAARVSPFREMHVWDASGDGFVHYDSADIGADTLGYIVENRVMQAALQAQGQGFTNIDWIFSTRVESLEFDSAHQHGQAIGLRTGDGRQLSARLIVGADGPDSQVRQLAAISTQGWDYRQTAVVATVKTANAHLQTAWQRFLPEGPLAFLPLTGGYSSIVWTVSPARAQHLLSLDDARFIQELQDASGADEPVPGVSRGLGQVEHAGPRASFPLRLIHARHYVRPRLALVGDAAHTLHPLAGQGVNLGLMDVAVLAELLVEVTARGDDIGSFRLLRRYERWRKSDNLIVAAALEGIKQLFDSRWSAVHWLRNRGLEMTNAAGPVKNIIMRQAMGSAGDLPKLARGIALLDAEERHLYAP